MFGHRAVIGLSLLSALLFCAFAAQSASAAQTDTTNTTAFTCVPEPEGKGDFNDEHCDEANPEKKGKFTHSAAIVGTTNVEAENVKVTDKESEKTVLPEVAVLRGNIGLTKTEITCAKVKNVAANSWIQNSEPELKNHKVTGTIETEFSECTVHKPAKCKIKEPVFSRATIKGVDGLKGPKAGEENAMGLTFTGEDVSGESKDVFAKIFYEGAECSLKNQEFPVTGSVTATSGPGTEAGQSNKHSGATLVFTPKFEMQKLHIGNVNNKAEFETIVTPRMSGKGNPITLTTTT